MSTRTDRLARYIAQQLENYRVVIDNDQNLRHINLKVSFHKNSKEPDGVYFRPESYTDRGNIRQVSNDT